MKRSVLVYIHIGFWIALIIAISPLMHKLAFALDDDLKRFSLYSVDNLKTVSIVLLLLIPVFYSSYYFTRFIIKKPFGIIIPVIIYLIFIFISKKLLHTYAYENRDGRGIDQEIELLIVLSRTIIILVGLTGGFFRYLLEWDKANKKGIELEKQNTKSTIALLHSQINPHFLFNTLHNIDALIHNNHQKASASIEKLSDIMRYMLKEAKTEYVEFKKEIEHLENYLSLEKLRLKNEKFLDYSLSGNYNGLKIAPMIMIPFVENAFKHGVDSSIENGILININVENNKVTFICENQYDISETDKDIVHGIGLETVKKRLDLIYKEKQKLSINSGNSVFKVHLEIELHEN